MKVSINSSGFIGLLTVLFICLKLTKGIDWSWWWVLSPIWLSIMAIPITFIIYITIIAILDTK